MVFYDGRGNALKPFQGKKWAVLGDSISMSHADKLYHTRIAEELGFTVQNLAASGVGYAHVRDTQIPGIDSDVSLITIMCGTNDMTSGTTEAGVGNATDTADSFCGTVYGAILAAQTRFPGVPIGIITPVNRLDNTDTYKKWVMNISKGIAAVCKQHSVPCLDLNSGCGLLGFTEENIAHYYNDNGLHPNDAGHAVMAAKIKPFIESLMPVE